jgi:hypothetical protein
VLSSVPSIPIPVLPPVVLSGGAPRPEGSATAKARETHPRTYRDTEERPMQITESVYGGRADDIYGTAVPVPSIYRTYAVASAIVLGPLGAWQVPARYTAPSVTFVPSEFWPAAVRIAVVDALAEALVRDVVTPPCEPGSGDMAP